MTAPTPRVFGQRAADAPPPGAGGDGHWIKYFQDGETLIHFLEEKDEWTVYYEHFNQAKQRAYPCTGDRKTCEGCTSDDEKEAKASRRYLVNCLNAQGYVDLYKVPHMLWNDICRFSDKDGGTMLKRDYTIIRYKDQSTNQIKYSIDREERNEVPVAQYADSMRDHQEALATAWDEVWNPQVVEDDEPEETVAKATINQARAMLHKAQAAVEKPALAKEVQEPVPAPRPTRAKAAAKIPSTPGGLAESAGDPPSEPASAAQTEQEDEVVLTEDQLRAMDSDELLRLCVMCGIEPPTTLHGSAKELQDYLLEVLT